MSEDHDHPHRKFWAEKYLELTETLMGYALRLANGRYSDACDLFQETFYRILKYAKDPSTVKSPTAYLKTIMRNARNAKWRKEGKGTVQSWHDLRGKGSQEEQHRSVEPAVAPDAPRLVESNELRAQIRELAGPLTALEQAIFELYLVGQKRQEIADDLGEDVNLVRFLLNRIKARIRSRLVRARKC